MVYDLEHEEDWTAEANWYKANPSLGHTIQIGRVREAYRNAVENPAEENVFKQLRLNIWTSASICWIPEQVNDKVSLPIDLDFLRERMCYGGLDLSSTSDITAQVLAFPPRSDDEKYILLPFFWLPEDTLELRCRRDAVPPGPCSLRRLAETGLHPDDGMERHPLWFHREIHRKAG